MLFAGLLLGACAPSKLSTRSQPGAQSKAQPSFRIAFGSCLNQRRPRPIFTSITNEHPDLLVLLGDNVYARDNSPASLQRAYRRFTAQRMRVPAQRLLPIFATWDDHDYGVNDGGADYPYKSLSQRLMKRTFSAFEVPSSLGERSAYPVTGVYRDLLLQRGDLIVQVILLDTRSFRSPLKRAADYTPQRVSYAPNEDLAATVLGEAQWRWLEGTLQKPASIRVLVSSIQIIPTEHPFEKWANFPLERARLLRLLETSRGAAVFLVSGDRHMAEISQLKLPSGLTLTEVTTSSLNVPRISVDPEANAHRVGAAYSQENFAVLELSMHDQRPTVLAEVHNIKNQPMLSTTI